ncbi:NAD(P)H-binding protein [Chitinophaga sp. Cy-1792]|uniref:NmrA family NAD(P)-binding protein n=1 Tax=Chitinophaga sp. Cy-1792 TaxID=2608339 RepID=UPI00141F73FB|nr:NAD(P)H-binding protein [Chitinophaga sp. Cy-1792]NIG54149.1 NAD(P)H-binding protein [Chitinophaga sp. Cy-1792]
MIAITGANGQLGQATIQQLVKLVNPSGIIAIVRDAAKIDAGSGIRVRVADYDDYTSLVIAFQGVDTLLQISSAAYGDAATIQEGNVVKAAVEAGVKRIVYTSTLRPAAEAAFMAGKTCWLTEAAIKNSGMDYVIFRNSMYLETIPLFIGEAMATAQIRYPGGNGAISFVGRNDIGAALAKVLSHPHIKNEVYEITGDKAWSFADIARILGEERQVTGTYDSITDASFRDELTGYGMPPEAVDFYSSMADSIRGQEFSHTDARWQQLLDRPTIDLRAFLSEI